MRIVLAFIVAIAMTPSASGAFQYPLDEKRCQADLGLAASKYKQCMAKTMSDFWARGAFSSDLTPTVVGFNKCVAKYRGNWPKLVRKHQGKANSCSGDRFADRGDGTFLDRLTRRIWEMKTNDGSIHDWDNTYTWAEGSPWNETGTTFTGFLKALNDDRFGGSSGWRLPALDELATLIEPGYPYCDAPPCTTVPGLTQATDFSGPFYWSSSAYEGFPGADTGPVDLQSAWCVNFFKGYAVVFTFKENAHYARAVRGGL